MRARAAALLLILAAACNRPALPPPPKSTRQPAPKAPAKNNIQINVDLDAGNLLNLAYGASVVSRTAESNLEVSALQAIDGLGNTFWSSPPGDPRQTLVFSLPTLSRIERLGITGYKETIPRKIRFDASLDGKRWREVIVQSLVATGEPQIVDVKPFEARYLRVETILPETGYVFIRSIHALGRELAPPALRNFDGCWTINGSTARLVQNGARITGVIASDPPAFLDGGTNGRVAMLTWIHGPNSGYATLSMDPETQTISGLTIYDGIATEYTAAAWIGKRCADASPLDALPVRGKRDPARRWSMYGLAFDKREQVIEALSQSTLDEVAEIIRNSPSRRFRIVAYELRLNAPDHRTAARIASLRAALARRGVDLGPIEFVAAGSRWSDPPIVAAIQRLMASRVDLERLPPP